MISQKNVYSLKKAINLFMIIALMMAGVAVNVSPASAQGFVVISSPTQTNPAYVKSNAELPVTFTYGKSGAGEYRILLGSTTFGPYSHTFTAIGGTPVPVIQKITIPASLAEGTYDLEVDAKLNTQTIWDTGTEDSAVVVDNTPPTVPALTAPNGGENLPVGTPINITWSTSITDDNLGNNPISLRFSADGGATWSLIAQSEANDGTYPWTPTTVTTQALVRIIVTDKAGNTSADESDATFTIYGVDNTLPTVTMVNPADTGTPYIGPTVVLAATASDLESGIRSVVFQFSAAAGGPWTDAGVGVLGTSGYVLNFDTSSLTEGAIYYFRAVATNGAGGSMASIAVDAKIDNTPPAMTLLQPAAENAWLKANYEFVVQASDAQSGISRLDIYQFVGGLYQPIALCSDVTPGTAVGGVYTLSCSGTPDVAATKIKAVVTNGADAGLKSSQERAVQVDLTLPVIPTSMLTAPADSALLQVGKTTPITWLTTGIVEAHLGAAPIRLELRRGTTTVIAEALPITPGSYTWTVAGVPGSGYSVCVVVSDLAGNETSDCNSSITIWGTDTTAPTVDLAPIASPNTGMIDLSATAADPESGIQQVQFLYKIGSAVVYTSIGVDPTAPYTATWNSSSVDGQVWFKAVATNGVGIVAERIFGPVLIDNTVPEVGDLSRAGNIYKVSASDGGSGIASVVFEYYDEDEDEWVEIGEGVLNPVSGKYESPAWVNVDDLDVRAVATDNVGLVTESAIYVPDDVISLEVGWNLISLTLVPYDSDIETILSDLIANESVKQVVAWPFEGDTIHEKRWDGGALQDVTEIVDGAGYWVEMNEADELSFDGANPPEPPAAPPAYFVYAGWNLIGYTSVDPHPADEYLGDAGGPNVRAMYGFDEINGVYVAITGDDDLEPGNGYWLAVSTNATIIPPAEWPVPVGNS